LNRFGFTVTRKFESALWLEGENEDFPAIISMERSTFRGRRACLTRHKTIWTCNCIIVTSADSVGRGNESAREVVFYLATVLHLEGTVIFTAGIELSPSTYSSY
jgi:hypothetical protein